MLPTVKADVYVFGGHHFQRNQVFIFVENQIFDVRSAPRVAAALAAVNLVLASSVYALEVGLGLLSGLVVLLLVGVGEVAEDGV